ncbi:MAG TPA: phosphoribosylaminoimidazolesuccinocarboxamide synthase [Planctomycetota bacterium]|nr:phosphoribosylaminoimidazolesuccinocarboxamide synthase [Planctomycetota bacterium]
MAASASPLHGLRFLRRGKVRDVYEIDDRLLLLVASDRISAFDHVLPDPVPGKGVVLTQLSLFWFEVLGSRVPHHVVESDVRRMPPAVRAHEAALRGRALLVRRAEVYPFECVARAFLLGGGWKEYRETGALCGLTLPRGLAKNARFPEPLFTPATKADEGHDENVPFERMEKDLGAPVARELRDLTLDVFRTCARRAEERGVVICDTKLEWGRIDGRTALVDEVLTPDSSRFWKKEEADAALPDRDPPSYDKQVVRDWLDAQTWDRVKGPPPRLPAEVAALARARYVEIYERIVGRPVPELDG